MSHSHERTLEQIFQHPIAMNIKWADITHFFNSLGATIEPAHHGHEKVHLNNHHAVFHVPHTRTLDSKDQVIAIRHFLEQCGITPQATKR